MSNNKNKKPGKGFKRIPKAPEERFAEKLRAKAAKSETTANKLQRLHYEINDNYFNPQQIEEVEVAFVEALAAHLPDTAKGVGMRYIKCRKDTIAVFSFYDAKTDAVYIEWGAAHKRKEDKYNQRLGKMLALIDILKRAKPGRK